MLFLAFEMEVNTMKAIFLGKMYIPQLERLIQGTERELQKERQELREKGYYFSHGGNGSEVWAKPAQAIVEYTVNDVAYSKDFRDFIKSALDLKILRESRFDKFCNEWDNDKIIVNCNEVDGTPINVLKP